MTVSQGTGEIVVPSVVHDPKTWHQKTAGNIPYRLLSSTGEVTEDNLALSEIYLIQVKDLLPFLLESFPPPIFETGSSKDPQILTTINRQMPNTPAVTKRITWKVQDGIQKPIDPFGAYLQSSLENDKGFHKLAKVTITYGRQDEIDLQSRTAGEFIAVEAPSAQYVDESSTEAKLENNREPTPPITMVVPQTEWTVTWSRVPRKFFFDEEKKEGVMTRFRRMLGRVNSHPMPLLYNAPCETILFVGYEVEQTFAFSSIKQETTDSDNDVLKKLKENFGSQVRLRLKFLEKNIVQDVTSPGSGTTVTTRHLGHNYFWRKSKGDWEYLWVKTKGDRRPVYLNDNLNDLFRPKALGEEEPGKCERPGETAAA